jgi:ubiquinone/menaquinone biosynthesis C-methylase UbiE
MFIKMKKADDEGENNLVDSRYITKYLEFYDTDFGKKILEKELKFVEAKLANSKTILSIGCGPAILEAKLIQLHPTWKITGLDYSPHMIEIAAQSIHSQLGDAQHLVFDDHSYDAVLYITSLEFIKDYKKTIREAHRVLKLKGKVLILMLNSQSTYFRERYEKNNSYIRNNIKHTNIASISNYVSQYFTLENKQYFLGIENQRVFDSTDLNSASLYVMEGIKT